MPGGLAVVSLLACAFFTALTGASGATIIALGAILYPDDSNSTSGEKSKSSPVLNMMSRLMVHPVKRMTTHPKKRADGTWRNLDVMQSLVFQPQNTNEILTLHNAD
jgi:hypothetical protein